MEHTIVLSSEELHLVKLGLLTAARVSRESGNAAQANEFSDLWEKLEKEASSHGPNNP